jgi:quercetin dioxygenase-like cupin family protein
MQTTRARYNVDSYQDWVGAEGIPIVEGLAIDCFAVETADWPRLGVRGAALHCEGRGDYCNMFLVDIPVGRSTVPQRHLYEEVVYVLEGRGSTQLEFADGRKRSFEWGPGSMFAIPLNARFRHFNGSGASRALLASVTDLPGILNYFHNERFIFDNPFEFDDRIGKDDYYAGEGDLVMVRQGNDFYETNFVPDLAAIELQGYSDRGADGTTLVFVLADGTLHAHISEMPAGTYKKAHRHMAGTHIMCVAGSGYSLEWYPGDQDFKRIDWRHGFAFPPGDQQFHQHFTTSAVPARYFAVGMGSLRYPLTEARRREFIGKGGKKQAMSLDVKEGGDQIEYEDQDPRIHPMWLEAMRERGLEPRMEKFFPTGGP